MKRPNRHSKPLEGVRTESYHPCEIDTQYAKDLNKYIDYLESKIKNLTSNTVLAASLPCTHTYKTIYIGVGYVAQCTKCGFVRQ